MAVAALAVVLTNRPADKGDTAGSGGGEVFLQNAAAAGPDPFTQSTARTDTASAPPPSLPPRTGSATPEVSGSAPGLYGGTQSVASCNVEQQVRFLAGEPTKNAAFASVLGISADEVPGYLRSLTPLQLRADTRVTNHGFRNGAATTYQAVLQSGTAVLVDSRGVPRVRCACGNPLTEPVAQKAPRTTGTAWPGYSSNQVIVVAPSVTVVNVFVVYDSEDDKWFARKHGDTGRQDKPTPPPPPLPIASPSTSASPSKSPSSPTSTSPSVSPSSPVPCVTITGTETPTPRDGVTPSPCPSTLSSPPTSPSDESPATDSSPETSPPDSSPATDSSPESAPADLTTSQSASGSSPANIAPPSPPADSVSTSGAAPGSSSASVPAPGPGGAPWTPPAASDRQRVA